MGDDRPDQAPLGAPARRRRRPPRRGCRDRRAPRRPVRRGPARDLGRGGDHDARQLARGREHLLGHPLGELGAVRVVERRREPGLAHRERPDGDHDARTASRGGSGTMGLRMLPTVDATYVLARSLLYPPLRYGIQWTIEGAQTVPVHGPVILASNHVSYLDPLVLAYLADRRHRKVRFLAKAELFDKRGLGPFLRSAHQIPVHRGIGGRGGVARPRPSTRCAAASASPSSPRGRSRWTSSRWSASPGTARLAQASGVPVTPVGLWGMQRVMYKGRKPDVEDRRGRDRRGGRPDPDRARRGRAGRDRPDHERDLRRRSPAPASSTRRRRARATTAGGCGRRRPRACGAASRRAPAPASE